MILTALAVVAAMRQLSECDIAGLAWLRSHGTDIWERW